MFQYFELVSYKLQLLKFRTNLLSFDGVMKEIIRVPFLLKHRVI